MPPGKWDIFGGDGRAVGCSAVEGVYAGRETRPLRSLSRVGFEPKENPHRTVGGYTSDMSLANLERKSLQIADQAVIVCDSSKFGKRALTRFAQTNEIDLLVTDDNLRHEDFTLLHRSGMEILKASVSGSTPSGITP